MPDKILIRGLELRCHLGVPDAERAEAQMVKAHLTMEVTRFANDDQIEQTVDYQKVADGVTILAQKKERQLIETLASDIADYVLSDFAVCSIRVKIEKYILPHTDWVGVVVERSSSPRD
jgi:dihydroneopterin aldolase